MLFYKIPRIMVDGSLMLRPLRILDASFLTRGFKNEGILLINLRNRSLIPLWLSTWWWTKRTFLPAYCIVQDSKRIGFIGLYNLILGESAEVSLAIFEKDQRRRGYGTRAFNLLLHNLQRYSVVKRIFVKVRRDNRSALFFWKRLGFRGVENYNGVIEMSLDLEHHHVWFKT
ncbi:MAG: GNAT family N-acetyltransferase [Nitrospirae bacterium]|nr:GNAT family N-acetyltransferase [Nitrospirota bacterium]